MEASNVDYTLAGFLYDSDFEEPDASSSPDLCFRSSPSLPSLDEVAGQPFGQLEDFRDEDLDDNEYTRPPTPKRWNPPLSDVQKALSVLESLGNFWGFSVYKFLDNSLPPRIRLSSIVHGDSRQKEGMLRS